ncbi:MAG: hypothetical protein LUE64_06095 [Candidatus Gastranaerophilales bacterium]|nr:hypothetical protein [Candidatus Gastranaerophilales bacterium]
MYITLSDISGTYVYIVPIVPPDIEIKDGGENETLKTVNGNIRLVGEKGLKTVSWSSIFPVYKNYGFVAVGSNVNGYDYVNFLQDAVDAKTPIRIIITTLSKRPVCNMLATVDDGFSWTVDTAGDIKYSISLTEFPEKTWDYINASTALKSYLQTIAVQSVAKQALSKVGLI